MRNFDRLYLVYDNWNINGFIPNCVEKEVFIKIDETIHTIGNGLESFLGKEFPPEKFNTWTNYCGFKRTHQQLVDFVPYYYASTGACGHWFYAIEPWGHWSYSIFESNVFQKIDNKIKNNINNGNATLIINYSHEGYVSDFFIDSIIRKLKERQIDLRNVLIIVNDFDIENKINKYKSERGSGLLTERYFPTFFNFSWYLLNSSEYFVETSKYNLSKDNIEKKDIKFLSYNKNMSQHRIMYLMEQYDKIKDNSLISFDKTLLSNLCKRWLNEEASEEIKEKYKNFKEREVLDITDMNNVHGYGCDVVEHYDRSLINITTETSFFDEANYISEKIWKPIWYGQPFILIGRPGTLKYLRSLGFKTFGWLINERYDDIVDNSKRFTFLMNEIDRLNSMTIDEIKNAISINFSDLEHNRKLLEKIGKERDSYEYKLYKKIKNYKNEKDFNVF